MALPVFTLGGLGGTRTHDQRLKRPLLYRLSYKPEKRAVSSTRFQSSSTLR
jgi:hypothetical protein